MTGAPETTETPDVTATPDVTDTPDTTETPEITEAPESDKDNIFDGTEKKITPDERAQTVTDEEPSDEEKIELAATNHTCNGISVSGIDSFRGMYSSVQQVARTMNSVMKQRQICLKPTNLSFGI